MKPSAGFLLLGVLLSAAVRFAQARIIHSYFKLGGTLVLKPASISARITSVVWKWDRELLAEWVEDEIPQTYYGRFGGRSEVNTNTGVLEIRNMTAADTGVYSVEINNRVQSQTHQAVRIREVPQPEVTVRPLMCGSSLEKCTLSCDGDVKEAEPVEYFWRIGDGEWEQSGKNMEIINSEETQCVKMFSCRMRNPVSERRSESITNPFHQDRNLDYRWWILTLLGATVLAVVAVLVCFLFQKL
ncbi:pregnancy-specific beta-1-glycoprotein 8-like [Oreochromis niloticus]|uniref:pregnancy-specific beta-1-glycoprotein 8-like n=1 Tax=Oreochromis niloticus TaxID=8128 RepID=UPI00039461C2|nr:pregnancy-specific beta-1-glycoprotein 8-like [Oreochromis niloticus]